MERAHLHLPKAPAADQTIREAVCAVDGVHEAIIEPRARRLMVAYEGGQATLEAALAAVDALELDPAFEPRWVA